MLGIISKNYENEVRCHFFITNGSSLSLMDVSYIFLLLILTPGQLFIYFISLD